MWKGTHDARRGAATDGLDPDMNGRLSDAPERDKDDFFLSAICLLTAAEGRPDVLTLDQAIAMALADSPALKAAAATEVAMQARTQAARANRYPQLDAKFVYPFVGTESGVSLNQTLWDFRRTTNQIKSKAAQVKSSEFECASSREDIVLQTKIAYYTVLSLQARLEAPDKALHEQEQRLARSEEFFKLGRLSRIDFSKARINLNTARLNRLKGQQSLQDARLQFASIVGLKEPDGYTLAPVTAPLKFRANLDNEIHQAFQSRPELNQLRAETESYRADLSASQGDYFPTIFGRAGYRIKGKGADQPAVIVGIGIRYQIFDGFAKKAKVKEAEANLLRSRFDMETTEKQIELEIRQAYLHVRSFEETLDLTEQAAHTAAEYEAFVQSQYRVGRASVVDLAESEALRASTRADHLQALYDYEIALAQLNAPSEGSLSHEQKNHRPAVDCPGSG